MATASQDLAAMYAAGKSLTDIAKATGIAPSTVRCRLVAAGVELRPRAVGVRMAADKIALAHRGRKRPPFSVEHRRRIAESRRQRSSAGVSVKPSGYVEYTTGPHKGRGVHVVTMERAIGRRLAADEVVHHVDEDRSNNALANLRLMTRAAHTALHRRTRNAG